MKKILFLGLTCMISLVANAQKFADYEDIKLKEEEDYIATEDKALECSNYIFTCKLEDPSASRMNAVKFVLRWMIGAPYTFVLQPWGSNLSKKNDEFFALYLAALVKFTLENKEASEDGVQEGAAQLVYKYIKDPQFRVEQKGYVKKFVAAGDAGTLSDFIK